MLLKLQIKPLGKPAHLFQSVLIFIVVSINILPQFRLFSWYNFIWLYSMLTWFIFIIVLRPLFFIRLPLLLKTILLFILYTIAVPYIMGNPTISNRFLSLAQVPFFYFAFTFNEKTRNEKTNFTIIKGTIPLIIFVSIYTTILLLANPYSSRIGISRGSASSNLISTISGGYDFIYSLVFLFIILLGVLILGKSVKLSFKYRLVILFLLSIFILTIILANYFTALIMLLSSITGFYFFRKVTILKLVFIIPLILIIIIGRLQVLTYSIDILKQISPNGLTSNRLDEIRLGMQTGQSTNISLTRESTLFSSLKGFIEHPITGIVTTNFKIRDNFFSGFGQHSQFLDTLALFGILGFVQIYFVMKIFLQRIRKNESNLNAFTYSVLISVLIINTFNNITALIGFTYFFVYPTAYSWLRDKKLQYNLKNYE